MREIWKDIPEYEGLYGVSSLGRVKNIKTDKILKPISNGNGYFQVEIRKNSIPKRCLVHRIVAQSFFTDFSTDIEINHKNGNKADNRLSNLEIVTQSENMRHRIYKLNVLGRTFPPKSIRCIDTGKVYPSVHEAARNTNISQSSISYCLTGKTKTAGKLRWEYEI